MVFLIAVPNVVLDFPRSASLHTSDNSMVSMGAFLRHQSLSPALHGAGRCQKPGKSFLMPSRFDAVQLPGRWKTRTLYMIPLPSDIMLQESSQVKLPARHPTHPRHGTHGRGTHMFRLCEREKGKTKVGGHSLTSFSQSAFSGLGL